MTRPVFFAGTDELAALRAGDTFVLSGAEGRHAATVKRLMPGELLDIVDGAGLRVSGTATAARPGELELQVDGVLRDPAPANRLVLVQALAKGDRDLQAVETATELGVDAVVPWIAERSIVRWKGERGAKARDKWVSVAAAAAKQARRATIPEVRGAVELSGLLPVIAAAGLAVVLSEEATQGLRTVAAAAPAEGSEIVLIVGPEGGISPRELEALRGAGARTAVLGPHVLRSSTAGPAAIAVLSDRLGRW
ncbi:MAG: 16S rRNA (uracil(1498)-N(3))-methyltransferase [Actinomycetales bacterium]